MQVKKKIGCILLCILWSNILWAEIITYSGEIPSGGWLCFRKEIMLEQNVDDATLKLAADSKYWLWINGEMGVREGGLKRGPNPEDTYCDVIQRVPGLRPGKNTVAVLVWYFGKDGFSHRNSPTAGIYFDLTIGDKHYESDATWKVLEHPGFFVPKGIAPNYRLPESNIGFDARKDIEFWSAEYDDWGWLRAEVEKPTESGWNRLIDRPIPMWKDYGLKEYVRVERIADTLLVAYLPYNAQINPYIRVKSSAGRIIDIRTDNYRGGGAPNVYAEYITKEGVQEFETWGWMNGHQVLYRIPKDVEVLELKYRETGYDTKFVGTFLCNDEFYNTLWNKSLRTLYITMRDTYMDCPDRERAQWWGDVVNELGEAFYSLDRNAHLLTRKAILELMNWQRSDSTIFSPVPAGNWNQELPMQMLASVGYYGFWTYYMGTGDKETIKTVYPNVKKYLHVWKLTSEGLVIPRKGGWTWGDWGDNKDLALLYNLWYSLALDGFQRMAVLVGERKDAEWADRVNRQLKHVFHEKYWNGKFYISPEYNGEPDDRVQALAVVAGVLSEKEYPIIRPFFQQQYHASPYMEKYVLEALCMMGYYEDALQRMKKRYHEMVNSKLSTLWEGWGIGNKGFGGGSYNHAWSGGPLTILSQYFAGVSPLKPAFKEFLIKPMFGSLEHINAVVPTRWGIIKLNLSRGEKAMVAEIKIPQGTKAYFIIPEKIESCLVNGKNVKIKQDRIKLREGLWKVELY